MGVTVKRVYDEVAEDDGLRVLVDRLWPRGMRKDDPRVGLWLKDIAPSDELRRRVHGSDDWEGFADAYRAELEDAPEAVEELRRTVADHDAVTLVYASKDTEHNNADVLRKILGL
jgi:uncharacterized protein YeaO (DUF488 family)